MMTRVAIVQMRSSADPFENLVVADAFVREARDAGADLVLFPENVFYRGPREGRTEAELSLDAEGRVAANTPFGAAVREWLATASVSVVLGSVLERVTGSDPRPYNSQWWCRLGAPVRPYRKIHLFDYRSSAGLTYGESKEVQRGADPLCVDEGGVRFGASICYDLRFPELYRALTIGSGAQALVVPAAFTYETGLAHWDTLLRARAVENLSYVLAPAQWGEHCNAAGDRFVCYGNAVAYDPWGLELARAPTMGDALLCVDLSVERVNECRAKLPATDGAVYWASMTVDGSQVSTVPSV